MANLWSHDRLASECGRSPYPMTMSRAYRGAPPLKADLGDAGLDEGEYAELQAHLNKNPDAVVGVPGVRGGLKEVGRKGPGKPGG